MISGPRPDHRAWRAAHRLSCRISICNGPATAVTRSPGGNGAEYQLSFTFTRPLPSTTNGYKTSSSGNPSSARRQQLRIQRSQVFGFRYRHQTVAPIPAQLSFDATFFVALGRVAVLAPIS